MNHFIDKQHTDPLEMAHTDAFRVIEILKKFKDAHVAMWFYDDE